MKLFRESNAVHYLSIQRVPIVESRFQNSSLPLRKVSILLGVLASLQSLLISFRADGSSWLPNTPVTAHS